jgi:hypothetical protein
LIWTPVVKAKPDRTKGAILMDDTLMLSGLEVIFGDPSDANMRRNRIGVRDGAQRKEIKIL